MRFFLVLGIFTITILGCKPTTSNENYVYDSETGCETAVPFGDIKICLPQIDGYNECFSHEKVNKLANQFNFAGNSILAYYLNDTTYAKVDRLDSIVFEDYCQLYVTNEMKNVPADQNSLEELAAMVKDNFEEENWDNIGEQIEEDFKTLLLGKPVIVESYSLGSTSKSFQVVNKYIMNEQEFIMVMNMNMILIKDRLVWLAHYLNLRDESSFAESKKKNDIIVMKLIEQNKS